MSLVATYSVFCDVQGDKCHGWIAQTTDGREAARSEARAAGWRRKIKAGGGMLDVCPSCHSAAPMPRGEGGGL